MNEWPNVTLKVHSIWTHTITSEQTKNQAKRTIIEWVMVGNSFCKHKDSATFWPDLETIMPPPNLFLTIIRSILDSFAWFLLSSEVTVYMQLLWLLLMPQKLHVYSRFQTHQKSCETKVGRIHTLLDHVIWQNISSPAPGTFISSLYEILFAQIYEVVLYKTIPLIKYCDFQKMSEEIGFLSAIFSHLPHL